MGLGSWLDKKADSGSIKSCKQNIELCIQRFERTPSLMAATADLISGMMGDMWPRSSLGAVEYLVHVRSRLSRERPDALFDMSYQLMGAASRSKKEGLGEFSIACSLLAGWLNMLSIAFKRGAASVEAAQLAETYEGMIYELLERPKRAEQGAAAI